jgi:hypothetical protein
MALLLRGVPTLLVDGKGQMVVEFIDQLTSTAGVYRGRSCKGLSLDRKCSLLK